MCVSSYVFAILDLQMQDDTASKFYLGGYARFSQEAREFATTAAMASRVAEGFQSELMEDPRVGTKFNELLTEATKELRFVIDIPLHVFEKLASVAQTTPEHLRHLIIQASHTSYHFLWRRVLYPASLYPWRLCRGNVEQNLVNLKAEDEPTEPCTNKIWILLHENYPIGQVRKVVELLGQCSWSSMPAEQQHASVAVLHRWHPGYGMGQLISRALLRQAMRLLPHASKTEKQMSRLVKKMQQLENKNPEKATASHMLVKALVSVATGRKDCVTRVGSPPPLPMYYVKQTVL